MFDLRKIETFCKVCEKRSFSKAGEALFLSQPTVSSHIQILEKEFEVRLLDRMGRTVLPTQAGAVLYRYAKMAVSRLETARAEIRALAREVTGDLRLGSDTFPACHVLPGVLAGFAGAHPQVRPSLAVAPSAVILRRVLEGEIVAGIIGSEFSPVPDISDRLVLESDIVVIAPAGMEGLPFRPPLAQDEGALPEISFDAACSLQWILPEENSTTRRTFETALRQAGHDARLFQVKLVLDSAYTVLQFVRAGLGVSITERLAIQDSLSRGDIRAFTVSGVRASRRFSCVTNARRKPFRAAAVFLKHLYASTRHLRAAP